MRQAKAFAFTIILVLMVANFVVPKPIVATLPHKNWDWVTPWPVKFVELARAPVREDRIAKADSIQDVNDRIIMALIAALAGEFVHNLLELNELLFELWRDWAPSPANGGGGGEVCKCDF